MAKFLNRKPLRFLLIAAVAALAGIINAALIFNLNRQPDYAYETFSAIAAMSPSDKIIVVEDAATRNTFSAVASDDYVVYLDSELPEEIATFWYILLPDSPKLSSSSDNLLEGFHAISELISDHYAAFELEKLGT